MKQKRLYTAKVTFDDNGKTYDNYKDRPVYSYDGTYDGRFIPVFTVRKSLERFIHSELFSRLHFYLLNLKNCRIVKLESNGIYTDECLCRAHIVYNKEKDNTDYTAVLTIEEQLVKEQ